MAKNKSKKTPKYEQEYKRELKNLRARIRYAYNEKGLIFEELPIPVTPDKIKKKDIKELKSLRGEKLWKYATVKQYEDIRDTDDYKEEEEKGYVNKENLATLMDILLNVDTSQIKKDYNKERAVQHGGTLYGILMNAISSDGEDAVAERVNYHSPDIMEIAERYIYAYKQSSDETQICLNQFVEYITGGALTPTQAQSISDDYGY